MSKVAERWRAGGRRFDRPTSISFIGVGMAWLLLLTPPWASDGTEDVVFFLIGAAYVVAGALCLASKVKRTPATATAEVIVPGALWLVAIAFSTAAWVNLGITAERDQDTAYLVNGVSLPEDIKLGLFTGTVSFLMWLLPSLGLRGAWRWVERVSGRSIST